MDEQKEKQTEEAAQTREEAGGKPARASFEKRVAAWVGVVYMVMLVLAMTVLIAKSGTGLDGTFPLLLCPAAVGVAIIAVYRKRNGRSVSRERYFTPALVFLCFLAFVIGLICGLPPLLAQFGIATPFIPNP